MTQAMTIEKLQSDGWKIHPDWDLRPFGGPVIFQKNGELLAVGPKGETEKVDKKDLLAENAHFYARQARKDRWLEPWYRFRTWSRAFGMGIAGAKNKSAFEIAGYKGGIGFGRWTCLGQPELDDAYWLRAWALWVSWPMRWLPGSLARARRRYHGK